MWVHANTFAPDTLHSKDFRATQVRCLTAATAAVALAFLLVEMLCYVLGSTKIGLHR